MPAPRTGLLLAWAGGLLLFAVPAAAFPRGGGPVAAWRLTPERVEAGKVKALAGAPDLSLEGPVRFTGPPPALVLRGGTPSIGLHEGPPPAFLPRGALSVTAWVCLEDVSSWGGIAGFIQDNGGFEKGWLLGYREDRFAFALASTGADDGDGRLTHLTASTRLETGRWYHVAGTYDGREMRLYVDGKPAGRSGEQHGPVLYPARASFTLGGYRDDDERFPLEGALREVRLYDRALGGAEIAALYREGASLFPAPLPLEGTPAVRPVRLDAVQVQGRCTADGRGRLFVEYGLDAGGRSRAPAREWKGGFEAVLEGLRPERTYTYRLVRLEGDAVRAAGRWFTFDVFYEPDLEPLPAGPDPFPPGEGATRWSNAAERILDLSGVHRGWCLVLGCTEGRLPWELARRTKLRILVRDPDPARTAALRCTLDRAGAYGVRVAVETGPLDALPYPEGFANLVVSESALEGRGPLPSPGEVFRMLRPWGGTAVLGRLEAGPRGEGEGAEFERWLAAVPGAARQRVENEAGRFVVVRRGPLPGAGSWTHGLADAGNTACSGDTRVHGSLMLQWFGRPGPRLMADRHHRNVPPLFKDGRLFVPCDGRVIAMDAYNGTWLWNAALPGVRRLGVFLDASNMVVDDRFLYVVHGSSCFAFTVEQGKAARVYHLPPCPGAGPCEWDYVALHGGVLLGSGRRRGAGYTEMSREADEALWYDDMALVASRYLFALDPATGRARWTYGEGLILTTTLAAGRGRLYFVENRSRAARADPRGRIPGRCFAGWGDNFLTGLDVRTGRVRFRVPLDLAPFRLVPYLSTAEGLLVLNGGSYRNGTLWYTFAAFDGETGRECWRRSDDTGWPPGGGHGEQNRHPVLAGGVVYGDPCAYDLHTGRRIEGYRFDRAGHGCGGVSGSAASLFWRGGNPAMRDLEGDGRVRKINHVSRPGCWINMIPAGGLLLVPEASSGCTCDFPLQTSMAYRARWGP